MVKLQYEGSPGKGNPWDGYFFFLHILYIMLSFIFHEKLDMHEFHLMKKGISYLWGSNNQPHDFTHSLGIKVFHGVI